MILNGSILDVTISTHDDAIDVDAEVVGMRGVDRAFVYGWRLPVGHVWLAQRLKAALLSGAVFGPATIKADESGQTYVGCLAIHVKQETLDADLTRLGY